MLPFAGAKTFDLKEHRRQGKSSISTVFVKGVPDRTQTGRKFEKPIIASFVKRFGTEYKMLPFALAKGFLL